MWRLFHSFVCRARKSNRCPYQLNPLVHHLYIHFDSDVIQENHFQFHLNIQNTHELRLSDLQQYLADVCVCLHERVCVCNLLQRKRLAHNGSRRGGIRNMKSQKQIIDKLELSCGKCGPSNLVELLHKLAFVLGAARSQCRRQNRNALVKKLSKQRAVDLRFHP